MNALAYVKMERFWTPWLPRGQKGSEISDQFQENMIQQKFVNLKLKHFMADVLLSFWLNIFFFQIGVCLGRN